MLKRGPHPIEHLSIAITVSTRGTNVAVTLAAFLVIMAQIGRAANKNYRYP